MTVSPTLEDTMYRYVIRINGMTDAVDVHKTFLQKNTVNVYFYSIITSEKEIPFPILYGKKVDLS